MRILQQRKGFVMCACVVYDETESGREKYENDHSTGQLGHNNVNSGREHFDYFSQVAMVVDEARSQFVDS